MRTSRRTPPRELVQYRHGQTNGAPSGGGPGETAGQLAHLLAHRAFQRQDRSNEMRVDWCTVIDRRQSRDFIRGEIHRKINSKCPGLLVEGRLARSQGQTDILRFRRHLQARAVIHPQDGAALPRRLRRRMAGAHHARLDTRQLAWLLEPDGPRPAWLGAPENVRRGVESARALAHALRCQGATRREGRTARLDLVVSCRLCGGHWTEAEASENCPDCSQQLICAGDLVDWMAAVGPEGRPLGQTIEPRNHGHCADWHPWLAPR